MKRKSMSGFTEWRFDWSLFSVPRSAVINHQTPNDLCCCMIDFPQWLAATNKPLTWSFAKHEVWTLASCEAKQTAVERANVLSTINHTSVESWMHTNLYVLDLCGRSNLTKIHTGLSSWSQAVINEKYLHKRKWACEKKMEGQSWRRQRNDKCMAANCRGTKLRKRWLVDWLSNTQRPSNTLHPDFLL